MKPKKLMFIIFILLLFWQGTVNAQTIHVILIGDVRCFENAENPENGENAKRGIQLDLRNMRGFFEDYVPQDKLKFYEVDPKMATPTAILNKIDSVKPAYEDTVVFYYTGHGANAAEGAEGANAAEENYAKAAGQFFQLKDENGKEIVLYRTEVCKKLKTTGAHFVVLFSDCCNNFVPTGRSNDNDKGVPSICNKFEPVIQQLFLDPKGMLDITTSEFGQYSFTNAKGSIGTVAWIEILKNENKSLKDENKSVTTITWAPVIKKMNVRVNELLKERFANSEEAKRQGSQDYYVYEWPETPRFGARVLGMSAGNVIVQEVVPGSLAEKGGLKVNDVIWKINEQDIIYEKDFGAAIDNAFGETIFEIKRKNSDGKTEKRLLAFDFDGESSEYTEPVFGAKFDEVDGGLEITEIVADGTAEKYGFKVGDVILEVDGTTVDVKDIFAVALRDACKKERFTIIYRRNGKEYPEIINNVQKRRIEEQAQKPDSEEILEQDNLDFKPKPEKIYVFGAKVKGNVIEEVYEGSPAEEAGLQKGDKIVKFNSKTIITAKDFEKAVDNSPQEATLVIIKKGEQSQSNVVATLNKIYVFGAKVKGNVVEEVYEGSPAEEAGLQKGDKILKFNKKTIKTSKDFEKAVDDSPIDAELEIDRDGETMELNPKLNK
ncbi:MAG: PDZ domain-containing protein [Planctomycetia bacterium]|nr:PDZ domain-containing protein [Planctomycetia bacterium]